MAVAAKSKVIFKKSTMFQPAMKGRSY